LELSLADGVAQRQFHVRWSWAARRGDEMR